MYFILVFSTLLIILSIFIGKNITAAFGSLIPNKLVFWVFFILVSQMYLIVRVIYRITDRIVPDTLHHISATTFALMALMFVTVLGFDIILLLAKYIKPLSPIYNYAVAKPVNVGLMAVVIILAQFALGLYNARATQIEEYTVATSKLADGESLKIALLTDIHVSSLTSSKWLDNAVDMVNQQKVDLVIMAGDLIDGEADPYIDRNVALIFSNIKSTYGTYATLGNHEFYGGDLEKAKTAINRDDVTLLVDEVAYTPKAIIVGRNDISVESARFGNGHRLGIKKILSAEPTANDKSLPLIVIDHQPHGFTVEDAKLAGADLMLSGHTHNGQFFPFNFVVSRIYPKARGHLKDGDFNLVVSSGLGTWGPPIRTGSRSEIVIITLVGEAK